MLDAKRAYVPKVSMEVSGILNEAHAGAFEPLKAQSQERLTKGLSASEPVAIVKTDSVML